MTQMANAIIGAFVSLRCVLRTTRAGHRGQFGNNTGRAWRVSVGDIQAGLTVWDIVVGRQTATPLLFKFRLDHCHAIADLSRLWALS
jgi:Flp pilus assembly protein TadB